jgi:N-methylhydantoinase A/oxoprolinase/acetone carboxylase beta subunit
LLCSDIIHDFLRSDLTELGKLTPAIIERHFDALKTEAAAVLAAESLKSEDCQFSRELDMRYAGQGYELRIGIEGACRDGVLDLNALHEVFHSVHEEKHGHSARDGVVEVVSYRLRARIVTSKVSLQTNVQLPASRGNVAEIARDVRFGSLPPVATTVVSRADLMREGSRNGPVVIVQFDTTTVIPRGWAARADITGSLIVERSAA